MKPRPRTMLALGLLLFGICAAFFIAADVAGRAFRPNHFTWGVTFSAPHARYLELDPTHTLNAILDELGVRHFRLSAYWNASEATPGSYDFSDIDWQLDAVEQRGGTVLMAVGRRLPHWPECHDPAWLAEKTADEQIVTHLAFLQASVEHLRGRKSILAWQVENEPFLGVFGECPPPNAALLDKEIALVRSLDDRPITVTESGELSTWLRAAKRADVVGVSMYRRVLVSGIGLTPHVFIPAVLYRVKADLIGLLFKKPVIGTELQMEPWTPLGLKETPEAYWRRSMSPSIFKKNVEYAKRTGLPTHYLWGVEWWYWMKEAQNVATYWELATDLFHSEQE